ncbi:MAG TPA: gamma-glutamylcyclotransferase family protein [Candidatus Didemnitutus sp.]|nr:gamma-glutamylcyclotransferase family protein [Candidatus Didemnitutus sp.]
MKLNFAYGSNLKLGQMRERCPGFEVAGKAVLENYRWIINTRGYANVVPSEGDHVEGFLYWLMEVDEGRLDVKEGVVGGSYRKEYLHVKFNGTPTLALVYVDPVTTEGKPKLEYVKRINEGILDAVLSPEYVQKYIRPFVPAA